MSSLEIFKDALGVSIFLPGNTVAFKSIVLLSVLLKAITSLSFKYPSLDNRFNVHLTTIFVLPVPAIPWTNIAPSNPSGLFLFFKDFSSLLGLRNHFITLWIVILCCFVGAITNDGLFFFASDNKLSSASTVLALLKSDLRSFDRLVNCCAFFIK